MLLKSKHALIVSSIFFYFEYIWYNNVPHPELVKYKKDQNWVVNSGDYLVFPGAETQLKDGATNYIESIQRLFQKLNGERI
ncbi:hypothetical protein P3S68_026162 [Capsicum galapagoense]